MIGEPPSEEADHLRVMEFSSETTLIGATEVVGLEASTKVFRIENVVLNPASLLTLILYWTSWVDPPAIVCLNCSVLMSV